MGLVLNDVTLERHSQRAGTEYTTLAAVAPTIGYHSDTEGLDALAERMIYEGHGRTG
jgi:hypothetical protein